MSRFGNRKNSGISPTTILPLFLPYIANFTYQKKRRDCVFFFPNLEHCFNFVCFREIFAGFDIDESYNYIHRVMSPLAATCSLQSRYRN